ncbi:MAG: adenosylcobinamide amidohydrolase [Haloferacaceae archaeon]
MTVFEATVREGVCRLARPGSRWLSTASGPGGGPTDADAAYNVTVPEGWAATDLAAYARARRERAGFGDPGPTLFTAVAQRHARRAVLGGVEAVVTAGLSNPTRLPVEGAGPGTGAADPPAAAEATSDDGSRSGVTRDGPSEPGTVNVVVGTERALGPGALADLLAAAVEAKAATLLACAGVPGTTTDAVAVTCDPGGDAASFTGSATPVGRAARACVRDALAASLAARHPDGPRDAVADAPDGTVVDATATVSRL